MSNPATDITTPVDPNIVDPTPDSKISTAGINDAMWLTPGTEPMVRMYQMQHSGCLIIIATPFVGSGMPILTWRNTPIIKTPSLISEGEGRTTDPFDTAIVDSACYSKHPASIHQLPVSDTVGSATLTFNPVQGIFVWQYEQCDIVSLCSQLCRYYCGNIGLHFQTVAKFTDQGDFSHGRMDAYRINKTIGFLDQRIQRSQFPIYFPFFVNHLDTEAQGYLRQDLSDEKHVDSTYPYKRTLAFRDIPAQDINADPQRQDLTLNDYEQYHTLRLDGETLTGDDKIIQMVIERKPNEDFKLFCPMYPFILNRLNLNETAISTEADYYANVRPIQAFWDCSYFTQQIGDRAIAPTSVYRYRDSTASAFTVISETTYARDTITVPT